MKKLFFTLFVAVSIGELVSEWFAWETIHFICKPLIMISLGVYYWISVSRKNPIVIAALVFSLMGDVLLMDSNFFLPGLVSFLMAHLAYLVAYRQHRWDSTEGELAGIQRLRLSFPVILTGTGLVIVLFPTLGTLKVPVVIYAGVIMIMVLQALFRYGRTLPESFWMVFGGAVLFLISDSLLAVNRFLVTFAASDFFVMLTYIPAQAFIVEGLIRHRDI